MDAAAGGRTGHFSPVIRPLSVLKEPCLKKELVSFYQQKKNKNKKQKNRRSSKTDRHLGDDPGQASEEMNVLMKTLREPGGEVRLLTCTCSHSRPEAQCHCVLQ